MRCSTGQHIEQNGDVAADQVGHGGSAALVGDVADVHACHRLEQFAREMRGRPHAGRAVAEFSRCRFQHGNELANVLSLDRCADQQDVGNGRDQRNGGEVPLRVVGRRRSRQRIDGVRCHGAHQQHAAIGCGLRHLRGTNGPSTAGDVLHHNAVGDALRQFLRNEAGDDICCSARREGNHQRDRTLRQYRLREHGLHQAAGRSSQAPLDQISSR
ncbi:hypothetical protein D3C71_1608900 [compost metagenome]